MELEYFRIHNWLSYHHGKAYKCENELCVNVNPKRFEWALLKGKDYKRDRNNYIMLCPSCHRKYDFTEEQRINQSNAAKGKKFSKITLNRISASLKDRNNCAVIQKDIKGNIIKEHKSVSHAAKALGILQTAISNTLTGRSKTSGGFIWEYKQTN